MPSLRRNIPAAAELNLPLPSPRAPAIAGAHRRELSDQERLLLLTEFTGILIGSLDYESSIPRLTRLLVPAFADCGVFETAAAGVKPARTIVEAPPNRIAFAQQLHSIAAADEGARHSVIAGASSVIRRPLVTRGECVGAVTLARFEPRLPFSTSEVNLAENLVDRLASGVDNARLYQHAQTAIQTRDELLAVVSHDLNTPLSVIRGTLETMLGAEPPDLPPRWRARLERVSRAAQLMDRLVYSLLDEVKIQTGRLTINVEALDVSRVLGDAAEMFQSIASERGIQFDVVPAEPLTIAADRGRLVQLLSNLIGNAMKFTPVGGRVTVRCSQSANDIVLLVQDTGCGVPAEHLTKMFERHWHSSRKDGGGTGLGLFISHGIVEAHGGSISAASVVGQGTTITVRLPRTPPGAARI